MKVNPIQNYITPKTTGYSATAALGISVLSGISKNKTCRKMHKPFAYLSAFLTVAHIGLVTYLHNKYKKM